MIRGMTGYGRSSQIATTGCWVIEIQTVNSKKGLEIVISLPKSLFAIEAEIRKWIQDHLRRGYVTVRIQFMPQQRSINLEALKNIKRDWENAAVALGYNPQEAIPFSFLLNTLESTQSAELGYIATEDKEFLRTGVQHALAAVVALRESEGQLLQQEILERLSIIHRELTAITTLVKEAPKRVENRLMLKLQEAHLFDEERIAREVVIYADRLDVTEEIKREQFHLNQLEHKLKTGCDGKTLDFIAQEMMREISTLAVKVQDAEIATKAIQIKSEIEKIREQVQNIE